MGQYRGADSSFYDMELELQKFLQAIRATVTPKTDSIGNFVDKHGRVAKKHSITHMGRDVFSSDDDEDDEDADGEEGQKQVVGDGGYPRHSVAHRGAEVARNAAQIAFLGNMEELRKKIRKLMFSMRHRDFEANFQNGFPGWENVAGAKHCEHALRLIPSKEAMHDLLVWQPQDRSWMELN